MTEKLRKTAVILLAHAEQGIGQPLPQWLVDCRRDVEAVAENPPPSSQVVGPAEAVLQAVIDEMMLQRASANNIRQQARNVIAAYVNAGGYGKPCILQVAVKPLDISEASDV